jgi:metal-responsive CopG/Arc/MetJ family transcriptional regulator
MPASGAGSEIHPNPLVAIWVEDLFCDAQSCQIACLTSERRQLRHFQQRIVAVRGVRLHGIIRARLFRMKRVNVTLAIEEDLLQEARAVAARSHTSVNEMVRNYLQQVVGKEQRRLAALDRIRGLLARPSVTIGGRLPSRDELHER